MIGLKEGKIRRMEKLDLDQILEIEVNSFLYPWSSNEFLQELKNPLSRILLKEVLLEEKTRIMGYICFWLVREEVHVLNLATHPHFRRLGIATSLIHSTLDLARQRQVSLVTLEVRKSNYPAFSLYKKLGFTFKGVRPRYYHPDLEDALIMILEIDKEPYEKEINPPDFLRSG